VSGINNICGGGTQHETQTRKGGRSRGWEKYLHELYYGPGSRKDSGGIASPAKKKGSKKGRWRREKIKKIRKVGMSVKKEL